MYWISWSNIIPYCLWQDFISSTIIQVQSLSNFDQHFFSPFSHLVHPSRQEDQEQLLTPEKNIFHFLPLTRPIFLKIMKNMMRVEIKHMIKLTELRNAEIAFVPWKKGISTSKCNAVARGGGGRKLQKIFEIQSNMKGLKTPPKSALESQNLEKNRKVLRFRVSNNT